MLDRERYGYAALTADTDADIPPTPPLVSCAACGRKFHSASLRPLCGDCIAGAALTKAVARGDLRLCACGCGRALPRSAQINRRYIGNACIKRAARKARAA